MRFLNGHGSGSQYGGARPGGTSHAHRVTPPPQSAHSSFPPLDAPRWRRTDTPTSSAHARTRCRPRPSSASSGGGAAVPSVKPGGTRGSVSQTATRRRPGWGTGRGGRTGRWCGCGSWSAVPRPRARQWGSVAQFMGGQDQTEGASRDTRCAGITRKVQGAVPARGYGGHRKSPVAEGSWTGAWCLRRGVPRCASRRAPEKESRGRQMPFAATPNTSACISLV